MDRTQYEAKMMAVLSKYGKFQYIGDMDRHRTLQHEISFQAVLLRARKAEHISKAEYDRVGPVESSYPILYGVPKFHKKGNCNSSYSKSSTKNQRESGTTQLS